MDAFPVASNVVWGVKGWGCGAVGLWGYGGLGLWDCGAVGLWECVAVGLWGCGAVSGKCRQRLPEHVEPLATKAWHF